MRQRGTHTAALMLKWPVPAAALWSCLDVGAFGEVPSYDFAYGSYRTHVSGFRMVQYLFAILYAYGRCARGGPRAPGPAGRGEPAERGRGPRGAGSERESRRDGETRHEFNRVPLIHLYKGTPGACVHRCSDGATQRARHSRPLLGPSFLDAAASAEEATVVPPLGRSRRRGARSRRGLRVALGSPPNPCSPPDLRSPAALRSPPARALPLGRLCGLGRC